MKWTSKHQGSIILSTFIIVLSLMILGVGVQLIFRNTIEQQFDIAKKGATNFRMGDVELQVRYLAEIAVNKCIFDANTGAGCVAGPVNSVGYPGWIDYNADINRQYRYSVNAGIIKGEGRVKWGVGASDYTYSIVNINYTVDPAICGVADGNNYVLQLNQWREVQQ